MASLCRPALLVLLTAAVSILGIGETVGQQRNWALDLFETHSHDFRTVGRGTKSEFHFVMKNNYKDDVRIAAARTSCGCTTPTISKNILKSGESGAIIAKFRNMSHGLKYDCIGELDGEKLRNNMVCTNPESGTLIGHIRASDARFE